MNGSRKDGNGDSRDGNGDKRFISNSKAASKGQVLKRVKLLLCHFVIQYWQAQGLVIYRHTMSMMSKISRMFLGKILTKIPTLQNQMLQMILHCLLKFMLVLWNVSFSYAIISHDRYLYLCTIYLDHIANNIICTYHIICTYDMHNILCTIIWTILLCFPYTIISYDQYLYS